MKRNQDTGKTTRTTPRYLEAPRLSHRPGPCGIVVKPEPLLALVVGAMSGTVSGALTRRADP